jgi:hypothetical protein
MTGGEDLHTCYHELDCNFEVAAAACIIIERAIIHAASTDFLDPKSLIVSRSHFSIATSIRRVIAAAANLARAPELVACMTEIEFLIGIAKTLLPWRPAQAAVFVSRALSLTHDPRFRFLIVPAQTALQRGDVEAARKWLDRATTYHQNRRKRLTTSSETDV